MQTMISELFVQHDSFNYVVLRYLVGRGHHSNAQPRLAEQLVVPHTHVHNIFPDVEQRFYLSEHGHALCNSSSELTLLTVIISTALSLLVFVHSN